MGESRSESDGSVPGLEIAVESEAEAEDDVTVGENRSELFAVLVDGAAWDTVVVATGKSTEKVQR